MLMVGEQFYESALPKFKETDPLVMKGSSGYDAQFYVQIALDPSLQDPELPNAIDNLTYRARRILMPAVAWLAGGGETAKIVKIYPLINPICWVISAILLLYWLPPYCIQNFIRWTGMLLGWGWTLSAQRSLTDGPAATLILLAAILIARGLKKGGAFGIAASALTKDMSLFAGLAVFEKCPSARSTWFRFVKLGCICIMPLFLWLLYLSQTLSVPGNNLMGRANFGLPFHGIGAKLISLAQAASQGENFATFNLICFLGIATQIVFILSRQSWDEIWWRIGFGFAVLAAFLGPAVWEGEPGAVPRVLLVLHVAFNLSVPKSWKWLPLLLLANVSALDFNHQLQPPYLSDQSVRFLEQTELIQYQSEDLKDQLQVTFEEGWLRTEHHGGQTAKWTIGAAEVKFFNITESELTLTIDLELGARERRICLINLNGKTIQALQQPTSRTVFDLGRIQLPPGENILVLDPQIEDHEAPRRIGACLYGVRLKKTD